MFGSYFQNELNKQNKKLTTRKNFCKPFQIPVQKINTEKPLTDRIS